MEAASGVKGKVNLGGREQQRRRGPGSKLDAKTIQLHDRSVILRWVHSTGIGKGPIERQDQRTLRLQLH